MLPNTVVSVTVAGFIVMCVVLDDIIDVCAVVYGKIINVAVDAITSCIDVPLNVVSVVVVAGIGALNIFVNGKIVS